MFEVFEGGESESQSAGRSCFGRGKETRFTTELVLVDKILRATSPFLSYEHKKPFFCVANLFVHIFLLLKFSVVVDYPLNIGHTYIQVGE